MTPVTCTVETVDFDIVNLGFIEVMTGVVSTVNGVLEVAVLPPTVTEIGPVVAASGTTTTNVVVVAERIVLEVPLNLTLLAEVVASKP